MNDTPGPKEVTDMDFPVKINSLRHTLAIDLDIDFEDGSIVSISSEDSDYVGGLAISAVDLVKFQDLAKLGRTLIRVAQLIDKAIK